MFDFYVRCYLFYCILLFDKNYRQYLVKYIIFIYISYNAHYLKKSVPQGLKRLLHLDAPLNNYEFIVHCVSIYIIVFIIYLMHMKQK